MLYECVFWDWNGTLLDDVAVAFNAVNAMLSARRLKEITLEQYREYVDVPIVKFYERVMDMSKESMENISVEFNSLCDKFMPEYPLAKNAKQLMYGLKKAGVRQYIFSSSKTERILPFLEKYGINEYISAVLGSPDIYAGSKAERTRDFVLANSINTSKCLFVGDLVHDCETATLVGSECVLLSYGHQNKQSLLKTGRRVFDSLKELSEYLNINLQEVEK